MTDPHDVAPPQAPAAEQACDLCAGRHDGSSMAFAALEADHIGVLTEMIIQSIFTELVCIWMPCMAEEQRNRIRTELGYEALVRLNTEVIRAAAAACE